MPNRNAKRKGRQRQQQKWQIHCEIMTNGTIRLSKKWYAKCIFNSLFKFLIRALFESQHCCVHLCSFRQAILWRWQICWLTLRCPSSEWNTLIQVLMVGWWQRNSRKNIEFRPFSWIGISIAVRNWGLFSYLSKPVLAASAYARTSPKELCIFRNDAVCTQAVECDK